MDRQREVAVLGASVGQHDDRSRTKKAVPNGRTALRAQSLPQLLVLTVEISRFLIVNEHWPLVERVVKSSYKHGRIW